MSMLSEIDSATVSLEDLPAIDAQELTMPVFEEPPLSGPSPRPAWIEIDLKQLRRNFELINRDRPDRLQLLSVVKDEAYGHGAFQVAQVALESGARFLGLSTLEEAMALRDKGIKAPVLLLGDRLETEL